MYVTVMPVSAYTAPLAFVFYPNKLMMNIFDAEPKI